MPEPEPEAPSRAAALSVVRTGDLRDVTRRLIHKGQPDRTIAARRQRGVFYLQFQMPCSTIEIKPAFAKR